MKQKWIFLGFVLALPAGCASTKQREQTEPICLESVSMDQVFSAAEQILTRMQFAIEKSDIQAGRIITYPLRGAQFFEFWRGDNAGLSDTAEASIQSLQRIAEIRMEAEGNRVCANCRVLVRRLSVPDRPLEGMSRAGGFITDSGTRRQSLQMRQEVLAEAEWIDLGTDPRLEKKILRSIEKEVSRGGKG